MVDVEQTVIGEGDAVGIAAQVVEDLLRTPKGWFSVNHPFGLAKWHQRMVIRIEQGKGRKDRGPHLLLQTRTRVLNGELDETFRRWYPKFRLPIPVVLKAAA